MHYVLDSSKIDTKFVVYHKVLYSFSNLLEKDEAGFLEVFKMILRFDHTK